MPLTEIIPLLAVVAFLIYVVAAISSSGPTSRSWVFPAFMSVLFCGFSLVAVLSEGLFGFWTEHVDSLWGNQVLIDLLLALGIAWTLLLPRAKAAGVRSLPWLVFIICTGCIGMTAMLARVLYLENAPLAQQG